MSNNITLAQVAAMADNAYINEPVVCLVRVTKQGTGKTSGKPYWQAELTDPNDPSCPTVSTMFSVDPSKYNGQIVSIEGRGNKKTSYQDKPQFGIGRQAFLKIVGGSTPPPVPHSAPSGPAPSRSAPVNVVNGQSIGMAVKEAHLSILKAGAELTEDLLVAKAGIFLRASSRLERGEHMQQAAQPVKRPAPGPNGQVAESDFEESEIPF